MFPRTSAVFGAAALVALPVGVTRPGPPPTGRGRQPTRVVEGAAPAAPAAAAPLTGFGGYHAAVPTVDEVGAQWTVPTIGSGSTAGSAATWIGAQGTAGPPFVQVGTLEFKAAGSPPRYASFWSDPAVGFHAQVLGTVAAGDVVSASLQRSGGEWTVQVTDTTTHESASHVVSGQLGTYDVAEWVQEDPTTGTVAAGDLPYPSLSTVTFSNLTLNGASPTLTLSDGQTLMSAGGGDYVPTPVAGNAFSLVPPTGYARTYLLLAGAIDRVLSRFDAALVTWPQATPGEKARIEAQVVSAYGRFAARILAHRWPSQAEPAVRWLARRIAVIHWAFERWIASGAPTSGPSMARLERAWDTKASIAVRAALGLPPA